MLETVLVKDSKPKGEAGQFITRVWNVPESKSAYDLLNNFLDIVKFRDDQLCQDTPIVIRGYGLAYRNIKGLSKVPSLEFIEEEFDKKFKRLTGFGIGSWEIEGNSVYACLSIEDNNFKTRILEFNFFCRQSYIPDFIKYLESKTSNFTETY